MLRRAGHVERATRGQASGIPARRPRALARRSPNDVHRRRRKSKEARREATPQLPVKCEIVFTAHTQEENRASHILFEVQRSVFFFTITPLVRW